MAVPVDLFAEAARRYCAWSENFGQEEAAAAHAGLQHIAKLYSLVLELRRPVGAELDLDGERPSEESYYALHRRFALLPFQYYGVVFDSLSLPAEESVLGDLADDLADIHSDLAEGLSLYAAGGTRSNIIGDGMHRTR